MLGTAFPPWPAFTVEEADAVRRTLLSNRVNYWTGEEGKSFEREFAAWCGVSYAIALANGTLALEIALKTLALRPGDEVIVTPRTFFASAAAIVAAGGLPVFADVDRDTQNVTAETIASVLSPKTRGIVAVHLAGMPCDMDPILDMARSRSLIVVEDCAQAHGARYKGRPVGSLGDIGAWSFCQDKIMTTGGEGGMVTTPREDLWRQMWAMKDHGKSFAACHERTHPPGFRWLHESFGTNARMLEMQAVIGRIQLGHMAAWTAARQANQDAIREAARQIAGLRVPEIPAWAAHAAYRCYLFVESAALAAGWSRDRIMNEITSRGVPCFSGSCPEVYLERAFDGHPSRPARRLPVAEELGETSLVFLVHPGLEPRHLDMTITALGDAMEKAVR